MGVFRETSLKSFHFCNSNFKFFDLFQANLEFFFCQIHINPECRWGIPVMDVTLRVMYVTYKLTCICYQYIELTVII